MKKTVFILGAGASMAYGYPPAFELTKYICELSNENSAHWSIFLNALRAEDPVIGDPKYIHEFVSKFRYSETYSIDAFLKKNRGYQKIGKLAIAIKLIMWEYEEALFDKVKSEEHWYRKLFNEFEELINYDDLKKGEISFITFNYDRTLEHYLYQKMRHLYNYTDTQIDKIIDKMGIMHVHGHLGYLPFQDNRGRKYNPYIDSEIIRSAASTIKLAYETMDTGSNEFVKEIQKTIQSAEKIYFLGFSFHPDNMEILGIDPSINLNRHVVGTSIGISSNKRREVEGKYGNLIASSKLDIMGLLNEVPIFT